jgi:hypothetical protein
MHVGQPGDAQPSSCTLPEKLRHTMPAGQASSCPGPGQASTQRVPPMIVLKQVALAVDTGDSGHIGFAKSQGGVHTQGVPPTPSGCHPGGQLPQSTYGFAPSPPLPPPLPPLPPEPDAVVVPLLTSLALDWLEELPFEASPPAPAVAFLDPSDPEQATQQKRMATRER